jgi:hypothetical protein
MKEQMLYQETQRFNQWWIKILLFALNFYLFILIFYLIDQIKNNGDLSSLFMIFILIITEAFFMTINLKTQIYKDNINISFFPFFKNKLINFLELDKYYVRKYNPIAEYGGWGFRLGVFGKGRAYNIRGNMGLQLEFKNGKKLLIGTQSPKELEEVLNMINK